MPEQMKMKFDAGLRDPKKKISRVRKMKVYYASYQGQGNAQHPLIRIAGQYLRYYDFEIGDQVEVHISSGRIEIIKV